MSQDMLGAVARQLVQVPAGMLGTLYDLLQKLCSKNGQVWFQGLKKFLREEYSFSTSDIKSEWTEFYRKYFRLTVDFSDVQLLDDSRGFDREILIPKGLTIGQVVKALKKQFPVWTYYDNLDDNHVPTNDRRADKNYAVYVRDNVEADEELKNLSANQLKERNINCITLLERLVTELKYWSETGGEHLNVTNITLCAGSRDSVGRVPSVDWDGDELHVDWYDPAHADDSLRARQARQ